MNTTVAFAAALVALTLALPSAQQPARDRRVEPTGAALISGVVVDDVTARPQRRAVVALSGDALLGGRQIFTGDDGRFVFAGLPSGPYTLTVRKSAYMTTAYGARRPGGTGAPIALADGQRMTNVTLRLAKYGAISGTIYDQNGEPAQGISVEVLKYTMRTGRRSLSSVYGQPATTDDRGVYRVNGLGPGDYYVAAGPSPDRGPGDLVILSATDIDRTLQAASSGARVASPNSTAPIAPAPRQHVSYAPVFFPGATDLADATTITLKASEDRSDVDIRLQFVPTARVTGTVTGPGGQAAAGVQVVATQITQAYSLDLFQAGSLGAARTDTEGRFSYPAVSPGRYVITAKTSATTATPADPAGGSAGAAGPLWALTEITVSGADQTLGLTLQPGMTVSGRIVFDGTALPKPATNAGLRVSLPPGPGGSGVTIGVTPSAVTPAGTFTLTGVPPGPYMLASAVPASAPGWALRSAIVNGADALDVPFEVRPAQDVDGAVVTFTDHPTELSGALQAATGVPTADYFIIVFSTSRGFWTPSSRRVVMARPATTGRYSVRNLPPGEYFVAAVTDVEFGDWFDPALLERLAGAATRLTLGEGEKKTLDLRVAGGS